MPVVLKNSLNPFFFFFGSLISKPNLTRYTLCLPPQNEKAAQVWVWLEADKPLSSFPVQTKDTLQLKRRHQILKVRFRHAYERVLVDVTQPLSHILPLLEKKFQIENINDFTLYLNKKPLDKKKSIEILRVSPDFTFTLSNENEEEVDEEDVTESKADTKDENKNDEKDDKINLTGAAKDIRNPSKVGFIQASHGKKKFDTHVWVVLKQQYLFQYKTQTAPKPLIVIDLIKDKAVRVTPEEKGKKTKDQFCFEVVDKKKKTDMWFFKCENEQHFKEWFEKVQAASNPQAAASGVSAGYFGKDLTQVVPQGKKIPDLVEQCTRYIDQKALETVGIFRLSGSANRIEEYRKTFDAGQRPDLSKEQDPHAVAGLLKLYFRNLNEPLLTFDRYDQFIAAQSVPERKLRARYVRLLIEDLPKVNFNVLKHLVEFLNRVQQHSDKNKMAIHNLATVFGPNLLMHPSRSTLQMVEDTAQINGIVNTLIEDYEAIFGNAEDEVVAVVMFQYDAKDPDEISLKVGQKVKVFSQDPSGWWTGEIVGEKGKIGRYPGTYVEIPKPKTKKQQFKEEMEKTRKKLEDEKQQLVQLKESKKQLEKDIENVIDEKEKFAQEIQMLRTGIQKLINENKLEFVDKFFKFYELSSNFSSARTKVDEARINLLNDFEELRKLSKAPADKNMKPKSQEKLKEQVQLAFVKINSENKKREVACERFDDLKEELDHLSLVI